MKKTSARMGAGLALFAGIAIGVYVANHGLPVGGSAYAAGGVVASPTAEAPNRYVYYPGTEYILKGRYDTSDVDSAWLNQFMKEHDLKAEDLSVGE